MKVAVWGLGYVGTISAACLARLGHTILGIEPNPVKVEAINAGESPILEPGLPAILAETVQAGRLHATTGGPESLTDLDMSLICVGTPSTATGSADLSFLCSVAAEIGRALRHTTAYHTVVVRSTIGPGVMTDLLIPLLEEESGKMAGRDFGVAANPEFLREASAVQDFFSPPYTLIGEQDHQSGEHLAALYSGIEAPIYHVSFDETALLKITSNAFHALKVGFANEIGRICTDLGIDSQKVMELVCADTKLNISPAYLRPGFAFGGSCLPKDLRALTFDARQRNVSVPILDSILPSNQEQINAVRLRIHALGARQVAILGLSFKPGTDDLRESPVLHLVRELWRDGLDITVYDPDVHLDRMIGSNRAYLERELPQIERILCSRSEDAIKERDLIVITQRRDEFAALLPTLSGEVTLLDLVRLDQAVLDSTAAQYLGIAW